VAIVFLLVKYFSKIFLTYKLKRTVICIYTYELGIISNVLYFKSKLYAVADAPSDAAVASQACESVN
jgi:hypothetical protein